MAAKFYTGQTILYGYFKEEKGTVDDVTKADDGTFKYKITLTEEYKETKTMDYKDGLQDHKTWVSMAAKVLTNVGEWNLTASK